MDRFYKAYNELCLRAIQDDAVFNNFRQDQTCITVVDSSWEQVGVTCIDVILKSDMDFFNEFVTSEQVGNPVTYYYPNIKMNFSPNTLRYCKILTELVNYFGDLNRLNIIEIGVGYGGQCKIIHDVFTPKSYTLVDYPEVLQLSKKYLDKFGVSVTLRDMMETKRGKYDLCISNYAFSEMERQWQILYEQNVIRYVPKGFMVCNFITPKYMEDLLHKDNYKIVEEYPQTGLDNFVYIWNDEWQ